MSVGDLEVGPNLLDAVADVLAAGWTPDEIHQAIADHILECSYDAAVTLATVRQMDHK